MLDQEFEANTQTELNLNHLAEKFGFERNVMEQVLSKKKLPLLWISAQDCTGCQESFLRNSFPGIEELFLNWISLEYSELLSFSSGYQIESHKENIINSNFGEYILVVEGSIPTNDEYLTVGGCSVKEEIIHAARGAKAVFAFGSCSSWGGIGAAKPNPTGAISLQELLPDVKVVIVPGCPPIAEVMVDCLLHFYVYDVLPELDKKGRPKKFYECTVHQQCHRKEFFDKGLFAEHYDDEGALKGYCLFKLGCRGPSTFNACESCSWNEGLCSPIGAGASCIGCSEKNFWDRGPLCFRKTKA
ncbi:MAG: hydrogenase small subunit [Bacillota bacterium]|nr:hydrogenase small subunit [Bacillota bacterium]